MTKPTKLPVRQAKTQISLGICPSAWASAQSDQSLRLGIHPVWSESSLSAWRNTRPLTTYWAHSEDPDQTGWIPWLIWVFAGARHFVGFVVRRVIYNSMINPTKWPVCTAKTQISLGIHSPPSLISLGCAPEGLPRTQCFFMRTSKTDQNGQVPG